MTADEVRQILKLEPHPREGGWFAQTYRTAGTLPASAYAAARHPAHYDGPRHFSTAIYYLLEPGTFSELHRLLSDEVFHHYAGSPVEMLQLGPESHQQRLVLGPDLRANQRPQVLVPKGVWQGSRLLPGHDGPGSWALLGCTVSPGFEYADYETGDQAELLRTFPESRNLIYALTRSVAPTLPPST